MEARLVALALLVLGVVGSVLPLLPGPLLSLAGVLGYWWSTGYADPGPLALAGLVALGLVALLVDYFGSALAARAGGASLRTSLAAALVGVALLFVLGPLGVLVGVAGTVFLLELRRHGDPEAGVRAALVATAGALASGLAQLALTGAMLVGFLLAT